MGIASANNVDFMIKGVFKFQAFGQELWVTTTEIGLSIVTIVILLIAIVTSVKMKKATEVPGTFQNIMEFAVETLDNMVSGKSSLTISELYLFSYCSAILAAYLDSEHQQETLV